MTRLIDEISSFLESEGFRCSRRMCRGAWVICTQTLDGKRPRTILPLEISAESEEDAARLSEEAYAAAISISEDQGYPLIVTEDRWRSGKDMMRARMLAHLEVFSQAFARNCEVRRIEKAEARTFLLANHSYGYAESRYCYGLFLKRHTGHLASSETVPGTLIAAAAFSNARKWIKAGKEIRSYEWTRFASLPQMRISGGMGKMLKAFIDDVHPDDIMSYADLEWSEGKVYETLGFKLEGHKDPVLFTVDARTWTRSPVKPGMTDGAVIAGQAGNLYFRNFGSGKYRLKLTDYE